MMPRVSPTEIVDASSSTLKEQFTIETEKVSPQVSKAFMETKSVSNNVKLLEECECPSRDIITAASNQQTTSLSSNKWREPPIYPSGSRTFVYQTFLYQTHVYQTLVYLRHMSTKTLLYQDTCLPWTLLYHRHISTKTFVYPDSSLPWTFVYLKHLSTRHISTQ